MTPPEPPYSIAREYSISAADRRLKRKEMKMLFSSLRRSAKWRSPPAVMATIGEISTKLKTFHDLRSSCRRGYREKLDGGISQQQRVRFFVNLAFSIEEPIFGVQKHGVRYSVSTNSKQEYLVHIKLTFLLKLKLNFIHDI